MDKNIRHRLVLWELQDKDLSTQKLGAWIHRSLSGNYVCVTIFKSLEHLLHAWTKEKRKNNTLRAPSIGPCHKLVRGVRQTVRREVVEDDKVTVCC